MSDFGDDGSAPFWVVKVVGHDHLCWDASADIGAGLLDGVIGVFHLIRQDYQYQHRSFLLTMVLDFVYKFALGSKIKRVDLRIPNRDSALLSVMKNLLHQSNSRLLVIGSMQHYPVCNRNGAENVTSDIEARAIIKHQLIATSKQNRLVRKSIRLNSLRLSANIHVEFPLFSKSVRVSRQIIHEFLASGLSVMRPESRIIRDVLHAPEVSSHFIVEACKHH